MLLVYENSTELDAVLIPNLENCSDYIGADSVPSCLSDGTSSTKTTASCANNNTSLTWEMLLYGPSDLRNTSVKVGYCEAVS